MRSIIFALALVCLPMTAFAQQNLPETGIVGAVESVVAKNPEPIPWKLGGGTIGSLGYNDKCSIQAGGLVTMIGQLQADDQVAVMYFAPVPTSASIGGCPTGAIIFVTTNWFRSAVQDMRNKEYVRKLLHQ